jgi:MoaA/NifB/PqqE/SkfB family radical SAM enzyme
LKKTDVIPAWGRILLGYRPFLSIEITKECPLRCPGCYAYEPEHLGTASNLRQLSDLRGDDLVNGVVALVQRHRPMHVSIVGGEPLVRYRELNALLPKLSRMGVEVQLVTSAVRPIPAHWASLDCLHLCVSVDGLQPEHDRRRAPATYDRILKHICGHSIIVHCTLTRQMLGREGYLRDFAAFWSERPEVRKIWFSIFTPQRGHQYEERLSPTDRERAVDEIALLRETFRKIYASDPVLSGFRRPPISPDRCIFALATTCISADLQTRVEPCQFGGNPVCEECGCIASSGLAALGNYRLGGLVPVAAIFAGSCAVGATLARWRGDGVSEGDDRGELISIGNTRPPARQS